MSLPRSLEGTTLGDFVVVERLGEGGHGVVYRAEQPLLGREAVIKVLHERHRDRAETIHRFLREARLASRLDHPYAAHVYAFGAEPDGLLWIAMEYVRGTALDRWLRTHGPMALDRFVPFLERLCEVIHTAHEQGIVHRDIKPANVVVLVRAGRLLPKLLDFGVAKALGDDAPEPAGDDAPEPALTHAGRRVGTPMYMAPELWLEAASADARSDLYALAVLAGEVLTGEPPFRGGSLRELAIAHARQPPAPLGRGLPPALDQALARALAKGAGDRHASLLDFGAAVRAASGLAGAEAQLPHLDDALRDTLIASSPQPIAESLSVLDGARNANQALDALWHVMTTALRYAALLALAAHTRTARTATTAVLARLRELRHRSPTEDEWFQLLRALVDGIEVDAHPVPELVIAATAGDTAAVVDALLALRTRIRHASGASETTARELLTSALVPLEALLRRFEPVYAYPLVVCRRGAAEPWMGLRRPLRPAVGGAAGLDDGTVALFGRDHEPVLRLSPLVAAEPPTPGAPAELFLFDGRDRLGARFVAPPAGFERYDDRVWEWLRGHVRELDDGAHTETDDERPPYRGLSAFSRDDAGVFFGRERETVTFQNRLRTQPVAAVVGPSGAGKTSFVQAGVLPAWGWRAITVRPGASPIAALAGRLHAAGFASDDLRARIAADRDALGAMLRGDAQARGPLVLVVDQLEELFTLCPDAGERQRYAEAIIAAARTVDDPVRVVFTLRDDFLVRAERVPALHDRIGHAMQLLAVPAADDLRRILVEPARRAGYAFEDAALASDMVAEVADQPGALALLSFTAAELWDQRDRHFKQLARSVYRSLGGVAGAFARHAEHTLEAMTAGERRLTREAFRHLVTVQDTRAVVGRAELGELLGGGARAAAVIEKLVAARLLVASDDEPGETIEIVHEALLGAWPRLVAWRREDVDGARLRESLRAAARPWDERGRPSGMLWSGDALLDYTRWRARHAGPLTELEAAFANASVDAAARARRVRRAGLAAAFAVLGAGLVVLLSINASKQQALRRAEDSDRVSRAQVIALDQEHGRQRLLAGDPIRAAIYLDAAIRDGGDGPALRYLFGRTLEILDKQRFALAGHTGAVRDGRYSPDDTRIVTAGEDRTARVWDAATGRLLVTLSGHDGRRVFMAAFDRDGARIITAGDDRTARLWDARTGRPIAVLAGHDKWVWVARFSPDGRRIVTASVDGTARLWDGDGRPVAVLRAHTQPVVEARFAGGDVYTASEDRAVVRWDGETGRMRGTIARHAEAITAMATEGDGSIAGWGPRDSLARGNPGGAASRGHVASADLDGVVQLYDATTERSQTIATQLPVNPHGLSFSPDGARLAVAGAAEIQIWDVAARQRVAVMRRHVGKVSAIAFSPDGKRLASASEDGTARIWETATGQSLALIPSLDAIHWVAFSSDGARVALGGPGGAAVWDARDDALARTPLDVGQPVTSVAVRRDGAQVIACGDQGAVRAWSVRDGATILAVDHAAKCVAGISPDGTIAVTAGDGQIRTWDVATGRPRGELVGRGAPDVLAIAISPDGRRVISGHDDNDARIWDLRSGQLMVTLSGHTKHVLATAWSDDGARVATCSNDGSSKIWNAATGELVRTLTLDSLCPGVAFDATGERLVTASRQLARTWDAGGAPGGSFEGHQGDVTSAMFGPRGLLVTTSTDGTARIWDPASRQPLDSFVHPESVEEGDVSADRQVLATRSGSRVYLWRLDPVVPLPRVRMLVDALPLVLRDGALVRKN
jgi:WD40 repeat protein/tRNA A-37 threonylcarbamoyl transferase component Bud32